MFMQMRSRYAPDNNTCVDTHLAVHKDARIVAVQRALHRVPGLFKHMIMHTCICIHWHAPGHTRRCTRCSRPARSAPSAWSLQTRPLGCGRGQTPVRRQENKLQTSVGIHIHEMRHVCPSLTTERNFASILQLHVSAPFAFFHSIHSTFKTNCMTTMHTYAC